MSLDAIGIVSKDIQQAVTFYALLGVDLKEAGSPDHFEGSTQCGVRIMVDSVQLTRQLNPAWQEPSGCGILLCFKQASPEEVDTLFARVVAAGFSVVKEPWNAIWGQRYASIKDPDGNQIDLFAALD